jgi:fructose-1,6-bisphosphatase/inositol monophosphatase family enzyme
VYYDPVTEADRNIETLLRRRIGERYPEHKIVGEEHGTTGTGDTWWIIDPIDGTRAFISGMPNWGILLGWVEDGRPTVGAMHQPFTGETYLGGPAGPGSSAGVIGGDPRGGRRAAGGRDFVQHASVDVYASAA